MAAQRARLSRWLCWSYYKPVYRVFPGAVKSVAGCADAVVAAPWREKNAAVVQAVPEEAANAAGLKRRRVAHGG